MPKKGSDLFDPEKTGSDIADSFVVQAVKKGTDGKKLKDARLL